MPKIGASARCRPRRLPQSATSSSQDVCLGIDIGSHRTRVCIWANGSEIIVQNKHSSNLDGTYYPGDFPSSLYVFDGPLADVYYVDRQDKSRRSVSAKYVFYPLAGVTDALLEQYPPVHCLMAKKDDVQLRSQLRRGLIALISVLRDRALAVCRQKKLRIGKIGLTIPVQWTLEFEDVYCGLVSEVFGIDPSAIYFYTETEALARYLYKYHADSLDPDDYYNTIMFFDYGGHNMNGCVFGVARDSESPEGNGFLRVGKTFGAGGGSEQWEHHVAEWFASLWARQNSTTLPAEYREEFLLRFQRQKSRETALRENIIMSLTRPEDGSPWRGTVTEEIMQETWRKGLERPLETARREISRLARMVEHGRVSRPLVVVSGGTAHNPAVKERMRALCEEKGFPIVFTDEFDVQITYDSAKVAKAAAYVVSETLTVEQFFERGAAIGIQMRQAPKPGEPKWPRIWDISAALLLGGKPPKEPVELGVQSPDEFRLICDPFFRQLKRKRVAANRSYDLAYLGKRKEGTWQFSLSLEGSGNAMGLVLEQLYKKREEMPWTTKETLRLPLYYDGNSGCIHVGAGNKNIDELALGLPPQPNEWGQTNINPAEESDESPSDSDPDQEEQPEPRGTTSLVNTSYTNLRFHPEGTEGTDLDLFPKAAPYWSDMGKQSKSSAWSDLFEEPASLALTVKYGAPSPQRTRGVKPQHSPMNHRVDPYGTARKAREAREARQGSEA